MHQRFKSLAVLFVLILTVGLLAACGTGKQAQTSAEAAPAATSNDTGKPAEASEAAGTTAATSGEHTVTYLGKTYTAPENAQRIVITGALEAMEDALTLDVHPVGAITYAGQFPEAFAAITDQAESIGEKTEPNFESILKLKPDVILGTAKFSEETVAQLEKIAPTILVSHISSDWQDNLKLMGDLTGKQTEAQAAIDRYAADVKAAQAQINAKVAGKSVLAVRIREGALCIYPADVFVNAVLYGDLGIEVPEIIASTEAQQEISIEQLAKVNPDYLFVQFSEQENGQNLTALDDFRKNPIVQQLKAYKNETIYVNPMNPLYQGGPAWSRDQFLKAAAEKLAR